MKSACPLFTTNTPDLPEEPEVQVEVNGSTYRVDSYTPQREIVSRKLTQLSKVQESTAKGYISELDRKYPVGATITGTKDGLKGQQLDGELTLEVPVQREPVPQSILDAATDKGITIRDTLGTVLNP